MTGARSAITLALLALAAALAGCRASTPAEKAALSQERGVKFLIGAQNEDGSFGSFVSLRTGDIYLDNLSSHHAFRDATSALCVLALQEPSRTDPKARAAIDHGVDYLLSSPPAGRASGGTFYDTWAHTYLVQALSSLLMDDRFADRRDRIAEVARRELGILYERQCLDGGWGYYDFNYTLISPSGHESTSFNTAAALLAMDEAKRAGLEVNPDVVADGLSCVQRLRLPSGAYVYGTYAQMNPAAGYNKVKGSLGRSQSCNLALFTYNEQDITRQDLREGLEHLRDYHHFIEIGKGRPVPHEAWYFTAGYYFMFGHYYASRVIGQLEPGPDREAMREWLAATMVRLQDPDGSWFDFPLYSYHKCYGTAFGLLTLQQCAGDRTEADLASESRK